MTIQNPRKQTSIATRDLLQSLRHRYTEIYGNQNGMLIETILACYCANRFDGVPIWLMVVGPASSGKTDALSLISDLSDVTPISTLTEASLLSGSSYREQDPSSSGGLLRSIGPNGILVLKDMGSLFSMNRSKLKGLLAALREIYDGKWSRAIGSNGGRVLEWSGKIGMIGGVTDEIDRHHTARVATGERYLMLRLKSDPMSSLEAARRAAQDIHRDKKHHDELTALVKSLMSSIDPPDVLSTLEPSIQEHLAMVAAFTVRTRSTVNRKSNSHEIEQVPDPEEPGRLTKQLITVFSGFKVIGCNDLEAINGCYALALDTILPLRRQIIDIIRKTGHFWPDADLRSASNKRIQTIVRRAMEDLECLGVLEKRKVKGSTSNMVLTKEMAICSDAMDEPLREEPVNRSVDNPRQLAVPQVLHSTGDDLCEVSKPTPMADITLVPVEISSDEIGKQVGEGESLPLFGNL